jgi:hypothetical protein
MTQPSYLFFQVAQSFCRCIGFRNMECHTTADHGISNSLHEFLRYLLLILLFLFAEKRTKRSSGQLVDRDSTLQSKVTSTLNTVPPILNFRLRTIEFWLTTSHPAITPHFRHWNKSATFYHDALRYQCSGLPSPLHHQRPEDLLRRQSLGLARRVTTIF